MSASQQLLIVLDNAVQKSIWHTVSKHCWLTAASVQVHIEFIMLLVFGCKPIRNGGSFVLVITCLSVANLDSSTTAMKEQSWHCCAGRAELGTAQWWWIRQQCCSGDAEEALNFAAADSLTCTIVNKPRRNNVAGTEALLQKRLKNLSLNLLHSP